MEPTEPIVESAIEPIVEPITKRYFFLYITASFSTAFPSTLSYYF